MGFWNRIFGKKSKNLNKSEYLKNENIIKVVEAFLNISNANDARRIMEQHPELLSEEADSMLIDLCKTAPSEKVNKLILNRRNVLAYCREVGIDQAFKEISSLSNETSKDYHYLLMKLEEVNSLSRPQDMPKKIILLQNLLSMNWRQSSPIIWASIMSDLGVSLVDNPQGNRAKNIEKAIEHFNQAAEVFTYKDFPLKWAKTQHCLANAYKYRILGVKAENIEKAIKYFNKALKVRTYQDYSWEWAITQNDLANAYHIRIRGDKAENIEKAIEHYNQALKVRTFQDFPKDWAVTQNNLASTYDQRIQGDNAENIEKAIELHNQVLKVHTYKDFPEDWADTQHNIATAYKNRIRGDKTENIEKAIEHFNQALKVRTYQDFPLDWAVTQNNLASAYKNRLRGDIAENIEKAIEHYNHALGVYTQKDLPADWATTKNNLATAYLSRLLGEEAENIEKAIENFNQALEVHTQKDFPLDWANIQSNLANAYYKRIFGDESENIEKAIEHYNQALKVRTFQDFPAYWAQTQNNLAVNYTARIQGSKSENIETAIEHFNQALKVRTYQDFPLDWAETNLSLAKTYEKRIRGDKAENIETAISYCNSALKIYKFETMPNDFCLTCRILGDIYFDVGKWKNAVDSYKDAIRADDFLYRSGLSSESKRIEIWQNAHIYRNACFATYHMDLAGDALLFLERGKTRLLNESLRLRMKQPKGVPKEEWKKYENASKKYLAATKLSSQEHYSQREETAHLALEELDFALKVVQSYNPEFQKELDISDILLVPDEETALLTFCITNKGSVGFVVSRSNGIESIDIPSFKEEDLHSLLFKLNDQRLVTGGWVGDYLNYISASNTYKYFITKYETEKTSEVKKQLSEACDLFYSTFHEWQKTSNEVLSCIADSLFYPMLSKLTSQIKRLILLPSSNLFILPLHSVPLSDGQLLCQCYCVSYAPSIPMLIEMHNRAVTIEGKDLYTVINPEEDPALVFSRCEGQTISKLFKSSLIHIGETGTKTTVIEGVSGKSYIHFSCHGSYNWDDPPTSGLHLVGGKTLNIKDLQNNIVDLSSARLVTLSACESGITDGMKGSADEFFGLPTGFMLAGVPCVVSSLWSVPDISTAILMERFYSNHIVGGMDIPQALQDAQLWVRGLKAKQIADYVEKCYKSGKWKGKSKEFIEHYRERYIETAKKSPEEKPFLHLYYWAAFTVNGA